MKTQRKYETDFKIQTVKYIIEQQKPVSQVARELEISDNTLYGWVMKELGLKSRTVKKHKATTNSKHSLPIHENTLNQQFQVEKPNQVWTADITGIVSQFA